jgi:glutamate--cysteine ligase catalytic subunit
MVEIFKGTETFVGLYPLFEKYMTLNEWSDMQKSQVRTYLTFIEQRAMGKIPTGARVMRNFVLSHPEYQQDSIVNDKVATDLMEYVLALNESQVKRANFLQGDWETNKN